MNSQDLDASWRHHNTTEVDQSAPFSSQGLHQCSCFSGTKSRCVISIKRYTTLYSVSARHGPQHGTSLQGENSSVENRPSQTSNLPKKKDCQWYMFQRHLSVVRRDKYTLKESVLWPPCNERGSLAWAGGFAPLELTEVGFAQDSTSAGHGPQTLCGVAWRVCCSCRPLGGSSAAAVHRTRAVHNIVCAHALNSLKHR